MPVSGAPPQATKSPQSNAERGQTEGLSYLQVPEVRLSDFTPSDRFNATGDAAAVPGACHGAAHFGAISRSVTQEMSPRTMDDGQEHNLPNAVVT
jgi:hypothetical protein